MTSFVTSSGCSAARVDGRSVEWAGYALSELTKDMREKKYGPNIEMN